MQCSLRRLRLLLFLNINDGSVNEMHTIFYLVSLVRVSLLEASQLRTINPSEPMVLFNCSLTYIDAGGVKVDKVDTS